MLVFSNSTWIWSIVVSGPEDGDGVGYPGTSAKMKWSPFEEADPISFYATTFTWNEVPSKPVSSAVCVSTLDCPARDAAST